MWLRKAKTVPCTYKGTKPNLIVFLLLQRKNVGGILFQKFMSVIVPHSHLRTLTSTMSAVAQHCNLALVQLKFFIAPQQSHYIPVRHAIAGMACMELAR